VKNFKIYCSIAATLIVALFSGPVFAQSAPSNPAMTYGMVPTVGQWNNWFQQKQDTLGFTPVNRAGDTMLGRLKTTGSTASTAGFSILTGTAPNVPNNGDIWLTSSGLYYQAGNMTFGPIGAGTIVGPNSSTIGHIATFGNTSGTSLVDSGKVLPSGVIVGTTDTQTLINKTLTAPVVGGGATLNGSTSGATIIQPSAAASGTLTLPAATDTLIGRNTTDTLTNKSINDAQTNYTRTGTGAVSLTGATRWQNYAITPQDFNASAGTGGDDSAALNAAAAAASSSTGPNAGLLYLPPPPSGYYNVCADSFRPQKVANGTASLRVVGPAGGGATIRALPGCSSGAVLYATMYIEGAAFGTQTKSAYKLTFENVRIDGWGISRYTVYNVYTVGLTFRNSVLRNAAAGNGANYFQQSGYETSIDNSNRLENVNDAGHTLYNTTADLPDYNMWITGTDNQFGATAVNARVANFYAAGGGNNHFIGSHGWGYPGGTDSQPNLRSQYTFLLEGNQVVLGAIADQPTVAAIRLQNTISDNTGAIITGNTVIGPLETGVQGVSIGANVVNSLIYGNNLASVTAANTIVADTAISSTNTIFSNTGSTAGQPWTGFTPTFSCGSGTVTTTSGVSGRYQIIGKTVFVNVQASITTNGTCAGSVKLTLPFTSLAQTQLSGSAFISTSKTVVGVIGFGTNIAAITNYDGTYPGGAGAFISISGSYEAQ